MLLDTMPAFQQFFLQNLNVVAEVNRPTHTSDEEHARNVCLSVEAAWRRHLRGKRSGTEVGQLQMKKVKIKK
jgi:hypothetical protein